MVHKKKSSVKQTAEYLDSIEDEKNDAEEIEDEDDDSEETSQQDVLLSSKIAAPQFSVASQPKKQAADAFGCSLKHTKAFQLKDSFNDGILLEGFRCAKESGKMGGSLFITKVNGKTVTSQLIYGTPKLEYPYVKSSFKQKDKRKTVAEKVAEKQQEPLTNNNGTTTASEPVASEQQNTTSSGSEEGLQFITSYPSSSKSYMLMNKWNGTNILIFKYYDANGVMRVSAKTKGATFVTDGQYGPFFSLTCQALGVPVNQKMKLVSTKDRISETNCPAILKELIGDPLVQAMSFELCGQAERHLVKYDFEVSLKPLFKTMVNGYLTPAVDSKPSAVAEPLNLVPHEHLGPFDFKSAQELNERCKLIQQKAFELNHEFRTKHNLKHKYEYDHFCSEGYVLYILNADGYVVPNRTLYKIKPQDIEEVHWSRFDDIKKEQVREAVQKMKERGREMTIKVLREELDIGPKEWSRFGDDITNFVNQNRLLKVEKKKKK